MNNIKAKIFELDWKTSFVLFFWFLTFLFPQPNELSFPDLPLLHPCVLGLRWFLQRSYVCDLHICLAQFPFHLFFPPSLLPCCVFLLCVCDRTTCFSLTAARPQFTLSIFISPAFPLARLLGMLWCKPSYSSHREINLLSLSVRTASLIQFFHLIFPSTRQLLIVSLKNLTMFVNIATIGKYSFRWVIWKDW